MYIHFGIKEDNYWTHSNCAVYIDIPKDVMQGKLFQKCTHLLYCSVMSLGANVNTRRMSKTDMGFIFHIKKSMIYSGQETIMSIIKINKI